MGKFAVNTNVSIEKSQEEIKKILRRYEADRFGIMEDKENAYIMFEYSGLMIQMNIPMPNREDYKHTETGRLRATDSVETVFEQAIRQRWRAFVLAVKAKLEAVETGISTIEKEFMAFMIMPDGRQLGDHIIPNLKEIAKSGKMPKMLTTTSSVQQKKYTDAH